MFLGLIFNTEKFERSREESLRYLGEKKVER